MLGWMSQGSYDSLEVELNRWLVVSVPTCWCLPSLTPHSHRELTLHFDLLSVFLSCDHPACVFQLARNLNHWAKTLLRDERNGPGKLCGLQIDGQFGWDLIWSCLHCASLPVTHYTNCLGSWWGGWAGFLCVSCCTNLETTKPRFATWRLYTKVSLCWEESRYLALMQGHWVLGVSLQLE